MTSEIRISLTRIIFAALLGIIVAASFLAAPAYAQGPSIDDEVNRIAKALYCPVCPNTPLDVCSTQACVQWRTVIKQKLQKGESESQIRDYFVQQYGEVVLGAPPAQGFNWLAYILPLLGIVLGVAVAWVTVRGWLIQQPTATSASPAADIPKEYAERIEKDLKEL
jgi:cytochrome c-type biogenesis protein CcmH